eukprot:1121643-Lingulodinium_polyedra.AAC.1
MCIRDSSRQQWAPGAVPRARAPFTGGASGATRAAWGLASHAAPFQGPAAQHSARSPRLGDG